MRLTQEQELQRSVASCLLFEDQFYENGEEIAARITRLALSVDPNFVAQLAIMTRTVDKLRHAPLLLARALASGNAEQKAVVAQLLPQIILRPDELSEFLALYWKDGKTPIAACVKKGLAQAFTRFNAFQLAKYNRKDTIKLRDVLFLVHAKPSSDEQAETWKQLVEDKLPTPDTWETELSASKDKKASWTRLLEENKLGALALLRNLRNMQTAGVEEALIRIAIINMKTEWVLPFRFIAAARYAPKLEQELEAKMLECLADVTPMAGRTALIVDTSASMWGTKVSEKSEMDRFEAAAALAILCRAICEQVNVYTFSAAAHAIPARHGFALRDAMAATNGGHSRGSLAVDMANKDGYDRIIVLTDGQWHAASGYGAGNAIDVAPAPLPGTNAYMINIASQTRAVGTKKWNMIDGWSESIITYIQALENRNEAG